MSKNFEPSEDKVQRLIEGGFLGIIRDPAKPPRHGIHATSVGVTPADTLHKVCGVSPNLLETIMSFLGLIAGIP